MSKSTTIVILYMIIADHVQMYKYKNGRFPKFYRAAAGFYPAVFSKPRPCSFFQSPQLKTAMIQSLTAWPKNTR